MANRYNGYAQANGGGNRTPIPQKATNKVGLTDVMGAFTQANQIIKEYELDGNFEGAKKTMEMCGFSIADLKHYRNLAPTYINNPIVSHIAKGQGVDIDKFLKLVDGFIADYERQEGGVGQGLGGVNNRQMRRSAEKVDQQYQSNTASWRNRKL